MELALADAGITAGRHRPHQRPRHVARPLNDAAEAEAIAKVFGQPGPPVTSTKGVTGHALGAAGALEAVAVVLSMQHRLIPPTDGFGSLDPELPAIDIVLGEPRPVDARPHASRTRSASAATTAAWSSAPPD